MRTININLDELTAKPLDIGYAGESHHVKVVFHCATFFRVYPNAVASMLVSSSDGTIYPVSLTRENSSLTWFISDGDVAHAGGGRYQLTFTQDEEIVKTAFGSYSISASMEVNGDPPEPIENWMQEAQNVLNDLKSFDDISASATMLPAGSTATAEMTTVEGHKNISLGIPKGDKGDKGNTGATGATPNISIGEIETLQPDQEAYVELDESSTAEAPVFNFGLPKGETGSIENVYGSTIEMTTQDSTKVSTAINSKLNANQGAGNAGKFLKVGNDGSVTPENVDLSGKADKVANATSGNFAGLDSNGNLTDSGKKASDFATTQDLSGKVNEPASEGTNGQVLTTNGSGGRSWATVTTSDMVGATASTAGTHGLVPAPAAGDQDKVLTGAGTWEIPVGSRVLVVNLDTVTNTSGSYSHTTTVSGMTSDLKAVAIECGDPSIFKDKVTITTGTDSVTLACSDVAGTSTVKVSFLAIGNANPLSSTEYGALDARIGSLSNLTTSDRSNIVSAINELNIISILYATWKASSSAAINVELTNSVSLTPGTWLIIGQNPLCSADGGVLGIAFSDESAASVFPSGGYTSTVTYNKCFAIATVTANVDVMLKSASRTSINYTYTERGGIIAIRIK